MTLRVDEKLCGRLWACAQLATDLQRCSLSTLIASAHRCGPLRFKARPIRALAERGSDGHKRPQSLVHG
jgi:hypothetical protein